MFDVLLALEWVQKHIESFGGDRTRVTIMGESAGGAIVTYLHTSHLTKDLFSSTISLSGTMIAPWAFTNTRMDEQEGKWDILLRTTNCSAVPDILQCLRSVNESTILEAMSATAQVDKYPIDTWAPIIDGLLVTTSPHIAFTTGDFPNRPLLSGAVQDEGSAIAVGFAAVEGVNISTDANILEGIEQVRELSINHRLNKNVTMPCMRDNGDTLLQYYTNSTSDTTLKQQFAKLLGDWLLFCPQILAADWFAKKGVPVYQYIFDYLSNNRVDAAASWRGVEHGEDLAYIFGQPLTSSNSPFSNQEYDKGWGSRDRKVSRVMMQVIAGFVRRGIPVLLSRRGTASVCWSKLSEDKLTYLHVTNKKAAIRDLHPTLSHCQQMSDIVNSQAVTCN
uniref:Carboxylic ester hydrolase n=1 Tax=Thalassocalyce inconstans TaxID=140487 RepID=V9PPW4_THAIN|nr:carboxylesterase domain-containing protein [Thalassocalyce inconstans]AHA51448.1 carboxylesterase domain-containing protein [Thalassocalyce inconstans]